MFGRSKPAENPGKQARKVLVIKLSALGDVINSLGAMRIIRQAHPSASIHWLTTEGFESFGDRCPYIDHVETDGRSKKMSETNALIARIRSENYDIVYDLHCSDRTANYFRLLNLPGRKPPLWSGHAPGAAFAFTDDSRKQMPPIRRHAKQLDIAGLGPFSSPPLPDMSWAWRDSHKNPRMRPGFFNLRDNYALLIGSSSAAHPSKRWSATAYAEIANRLEAHGIEAVLIGAKEDGAVNTEIGRIAPRARNLTTRTDLFQLAALAAEARIVIGNDSGPLHLAAASGAQVIALFATEHSDPEEVIAPESKVITISAKSVDEISVDTVWQMVPALGALPQKVSS